MLREYIVRIDKKSITLQKKQEKEEVRICELEKKNGHEQRQINALQQEIKDLKAIIKTKN